MTTNENIVPLDNHASGVEIKPLEKPVEKPAEVPLDGAQAADEQIQTLDNHASGPRP